MAGSPSPLSLFAQRIVVGVGDMAVSNNSAAILSTYALGSCIGIAAYDPSTQVSGMLHIMLPESQLSPEKARVQPSMFADTGLKVFLEALGGLRADKRKTKFYLTGGAAVLGKTDLFKIGSRNAQAVRGILLRERCIIKGEDVGGNNNRTIHLHIATGELEIKLPTGIRKVSLA